MSTYSHKEQILALYHQQTVEELFDDYADTFDEHLQNGLRYNVPALLYKAWSHHHQAKLSQRCLDLGCGTGLAGQAFRPDCTYLEGVDLSHGMCEQAKRKEVYDTVVHGSLLSHMINLEKQASYFDLILSADVFMYVLNLDIVLKQATRILSVDGYLVFSTESVLEEEEEEEDLAVGEAKKFVRRESERFAHRRQYVLDVCAKEMLCLVSVERVVLRMDDVQPVLGDIFVFQKRLVP